MVKRAALNIAKEYLTHLPADLDVRKAYLFGSYARGNQVNESDIDIAVIVGSNKNIFDIQMQLLQLRRKIDLRIEPHPIKEKDFSISNPFVDEILQSGIELV